VQTVASMAGLESPRSAGVVKIGRDGHVMLSPSATCTGWAPEAEKAKPSRAAAVRGTAEKRKVCHTGLGTARGGVLGKVVVAPSRKVPVTPGVRALQTSLERRLTARQQEAAMEARLDAAAAKPDGAWAWPEAAKARAQQALAGLPCDPQAMASVSDAITRAMLLQVKQNRSLLRAAADEAARDITLRSSMRMGGG